MKVPVTMFIGEPGRAFERVGLPFQAYGFEPPKPDIEGGLSKQEQERCALGDHPRGERVRGPICEPCWFVCLKRFIPRRRTSGRKLASEENARAFAGHPTPRDRFRRLGGGILRAEMPFSLIADEKGGAK